MKIAQGQQPVQQKQEKDAGTKDPTASSSTQEKAASAKAYIENKYAKATYEEKERREAWDKLTKQMNDMNLST